MRINNLQNFDTRLIIARNLISCYPSLFWILLSAFNFRLKERKIFIYSVYVNVYFIDNDLYRI